MGSCRKILEREEFFFSPFLCYIRMCTNTKGGCFLPTSLSVIVLYLFRCSLALPLKSSLIKQTFTKVLLCTRYQYIFSALHGCSINVFLCEATINKQIKKNLPGSIKLSAENYYQAKSNGQGNFTWSGQDGYKYLKENLNDEKEPSMRR